MDIQAIGLRHLSDALSGKMSHCIVSEWKDDAGEPIKLYWRPLTALVQQKIDQGNTSIDRILLTVKHRALDADGRQVFKDTPLESLRSDFDFDVLKSIAYLIATDFGQVDDLIEASVKE